MTFKSIAMQPTKKWRQLRPQTVLLAVTAAAALVALEVVVLEEVVLAEAGKIIRITLSVLYKNYIHYYR